MITFGSVCSGIEAASVAWEPLGFQPSWFSQFDPEHNYSRGPDFPSAVLAHHWPHVPNLGDMTLIAEAVRHGFIDAPDVLVGGTPCQAFSVAGLRGGLSDGRGFLTLKFVELANEIDRQRSEPCIIVWENVPGVLSSKDNAFGCFLAGLAGESEPLIPSGVNGQTLVMCLDHRAQSLGGSSTPNISEWPNDAVVCSLSQVLEQGSIPPRYFLSLTACAGILRRAEKRGKKLPELRGSGTESSGNWPAEVACTLNAAFGQKLGLEDQHVNGGCPLFVPVNAYGFQQRIGRNGRGDMGELVNALTAQAGETGKGDAAPCVAIALQDVSGREKAQNGKGWSDDGVSYTLDAAATQGVAVCVMSPVTHTQVRRLTPIECERLQGFPDGHTLLTNRPADGPRYKALGNSMAVPVMRWIGNRIILHILGAI